MSTSRKLKFKSSVHIDVEDFELRPKEFRFIQTDVLGDHPVFSERFDVALCTDGIEHFLKEDGLRLANRMTQLADLSIVFTPLGDYKVDTQSRCPHAHKSGWRTGDLPGWQCMVFPNWHVSLGIGAVFFWTRK